MMLQKKDKIPLSSPVSSLYCHFFSPSFEEINLIKFQSSCMSTHSVVIQRFYLHVQHWIFLYAIVHPTHVWNCLIKIFANTNANTMNRWKCIEVLLLQRFRNVLQWMYDNRLFVHLYFDVLPFLNWAQLKCSRRKCLHFVYTLCSHYSRYHIFSAILHKLS